jgi:hypothetical protein
MDFNRNYSKSVAALLMRTLSREPGLSSNTQSLRMCARNLSIGLAMPVGFEANLFVARF